MEMLIVAQQLLLCPGACRSVGHHGEACALTAIRHISSHRHLDRNNHCDLHSLLWPGLRRATSSTDSMEHMGWEAGERRGKWILGRFWCRRQRLPWQPLRELRNTLWLSQYSQAAKGICPMGKDTGAVEIARRHRRNIIQPMAI